MQDREVAQRVGTVAFLADFSMDGDGPDLRALRDLCDRYGAGLIVDEAHALGVFGPRGAGRCAEAGVRADILVGTFGKAVGTQGAFAASDERARAWLWNRARSFVFSTAPSPLLAKLTLFHVKHVQGLEAERARLSTLAAAFRATLTSGGLEVPATSFGPIVPVVVGDTARALDIAARLRKRGILAQAIRPPTVPEGTARLRVTLRATWTEEETQRLAAELLGAA